jgi:tRNA(fMet)-specific endonuclease VapC
MALYILDTDILSLFQDGDVAVTARLALAPATDYCISVITVEEQLNGWLAFIRRATRPSQTELGYRELGLTVCFLSGFRILPFTQQAIARFESLKRLKLNVGGNDLRIAASALEASAVVVTRNARDFGRVPGLVIEDWSQAPPALPTTPPVVP